MFVKTKKSLARFGIFIAIAGTFSIANASYENTRPRSALEHWKDRSLCRLTPETPSFEACVQSQMATATFRSFELIPASNRRRKDVAVVMFHGLASTPYSMAHLGFEIAKRHNLQVFGMTLSGHGEGFQNPNVLPGTDTSALGYVTMEYWINDLRSAFSLAGQQGIKKIIFIGHSTGAMLSKLAAIDQDLQDRTAGVILLSPPENKANLLSVSGLTDRVKKNGLWKSLWEGQNAAKMCDTVFISDRSLPQEWIKERPDFYADFDPNKFMNFKDLDGLQLRFLWTSALKALKNPSLMEYRAPNVNGVCHLNRLMELIQQRTSKVPTIVPITLIIANNDNLINAPLALESLRKQTRSFRHKIIHDAGHAGYLLSPRVYEDRKIKSPVVNPQVWFEGDGPDFGNLRRSQKAFDQAVEEIDKSLEVMLK